MRGFMTRFRVIAQPQGGKIKLWDRSSMWGKNEFGSWCYLWSKIGFQQFQQKKGRQPPLVDPGPVAQPVELVAGQSMTGAVWVQLWGLLGSWWVNYSLPPHGIYPSLETQITEEDTFRPGIYWAVLSEILDIFRQPCQPKFKKGYKGEGVQQSW